MALLGTIRQRLRRLEAESGRSYNLAIEEFPHPGGPPDTPADLIAASIPDLVEVTVGAGGALLLMSAECLVAAVSEEAAYVYAGIYIDDVLLTEPGVEGVPNSTELPVAESSPENDPDFLWAQIATTSTSEQIGGVYGAGAGGADQRKRGQSAQVVGSDNKPPVVNASVPEGVHTIELRWAFESDDEAAVMLLAERRLVVWAA